MGKARSARAVWRANRPPAIAAMLMALQVSPSTLLRRDPKGLTMPWPAHTI
jgi:hypothetical protein